MIFFSPELNEPFPQLRIIYPSWLSFVSSSDTCMTNYTTGNTEDCTVAWLEDDREENNLNISHSQIVINSRGSPDIIFDDGIMFPDIISINFTLTVNEDLEAGKGDLDSMVVGYVLCKHSYFQSWPDNIEQCGPFSGVKVTVATPDCSDLLPLCSACISCSSALEDTNIPEHVFSNDSAFWAPAIRTGPNWEHFLEIFMRRKVIISRIKIYGVDSDDVR